MWLRTDSFALRGLTASDLSWSVGGQPRRFGLGKSSEKCFRPSAKSFSSERGFLVRLAGLLLAPGKAKALLKSLAVVYGGVFARWPVPCYIAIPPRGSQCRIRPRSPSTKGPQDDGRRSAA